MSFVWRSATHVRTVTVTQAMVDQIADILGIPQTERGQFISGTIHFAPSPPTSQQPPPQQP
jgi:hypothetical protein